MASFNKSAGRIYPPKGIREGGARVDFRPDVSFDAMVEWHGVRFAWSRMTVCPCRGLNNQTDQVNPECPQCNALGWRPVPTTGYRQDPAKVGPMTPLQQLLIDRNRGMVIRGITTSMGEQPNMFSVLGNWALGSVLVTVRADNKLGYYDRLIYLDDLMPFSQLLTQGTSPTLKLRYPAECLNSLVSETQEFGEQDVQLVCGDVVWRAGRQPPDGTVLSCNYLCHPVFTVIEFPHLIRTIPVRALKLKRPATSPAGGHMFLPLQVVARLEHLALEPRA